MRELVAYAYNEFMKVKHYDDERDWPDFESLPDLDKRCWMAVAQAISDSTRGWIQTRISGPMEQ